MRGNNSGNGNESGYVIPTASSAFIKAPNQPAKSASPVKVTGKDLRIKK
jgi:hypothetical protein